jgi:hypothetical protein
MTRFADLMPFPASWVIPLALTIAACGQPHVVRAAPRSLPGADPVDRFPAPDPEAWDVTAPAGLPFARCQLNQDEINRMLGSFVYGAISAQEIERKTFSIDACY